MTTPNRYASQRGERFETSVLVLILLTVGGFAGAASFRHVHDWTMTNSPTGTGSWFGWANAVVSELVPIAALLVMRRRRRAGQPVVYPVILLIGALVLSVTAQLAVARPGVSGGVVSVVPALAFAALAKLVLGKAPKTVDLTKAPVGNARPSAVPTVPDAALVVPAPVGGDADDRSGVPAQVAPLALPETVTLELVQAARRAAVAVLKEHGRSITRDELRERLRVRTETASEVLRMIRDASTERLAEDAPTVNGRPVQGLIGTVTR